MDKAKALFIAVGSFLSSILGALFVPVLLLVSCNIIDYITGLMAVSNRGKKISSYRSFKGIAKKVSMWLLVVVGAIIDSLLGYCVTQFGMDFPFDFLVSCVVAVWLVCNELISILENIIDINGDKILPPFLLPLVKLIKKQTEETIKIEDSESE